MESGSKEELDAYRTEARGMIRAGENGMKVHALDDDKTNLVTNADLEKRHDHDKNVADNFANKTGGEKGVVFYGANHAGGRDGTNGKDLEEHLGDRGTVGRVGLAPDSKDFDEGLNGNMEAPNSVIYTDKKMGGIDLPGNQVQAVNLKKDGQMLPAGGEANIVNPGDDGAAEYKKVGEKDLMKLKPPSASNPEYMQQRAAEQAAGASK